MKFKKELLVGIIAVIAAVGLYSGVKFLQGMDLFSPTHHYYIIYENENGLGLSNTVTINQHTIGSVKEIELLQELDNKILVRVEVDKAFKISKKTNAIMISSDLFGTRAISLTYQDSIPLTGFYQSGDTIKYSHLDKEIMDVVAEKAEPVIARLDTTFDRLNRLMDDKTNKELHKILVNLALTTKALSVTSREVGPQIEGLTTQINATLQGLDATQRSLRPVIAKLEAVGDSLQAAEIVKAVDNTNKTIESLNTMLSELQSGKGTLGKLMTDTTLYTNLSGTIDSLNAVVTDIHKRPYRYVNLYGTNPKKQAKMADEEEKLQKKNKDCNGCTDHLK